jgi:hypothetical protein
MHIVSAQSEGCGDILWFLFEITVFDLYAYRPAVTDLDKGRHESAPVHVTKSGKTWTMIFEWRSEYTDIVELVPVHLHILDMDMKELILEFAEGLQVVHHHPHEVRRIVIEAEIGRGDDLEHPPPDRRTIGEVLTGRPFIL